MAQEEKPSKRNQVFLAALLHDIGKFYQRADNGMNEQNNALSDYSKHLAEDICPVNDAGRFGYQHVVWTNEFLLKHQGLFNQIDGFRENPWNTGLDKEDNLQSLACNHHKPVSLLQGLITLADWWSAGIDRTTPETLEKDELSGEKISWGKKRYKRIPLYSVFNKLRNGDGKMAYPLTPLDAESRIACFPTPVMSPEDGIDQKLYADLWKRFCTELSKVPTNSFNGFAETLVGLLKKYTWCIPSNTMDMADVSLFDHLRTTGAFADCFYNYHLENPDAFSFDSSTRRIRLADGHYPVLLLGGDVSGIQKFIYNISSKGAAKSLKGRSFYVELLVDSVMQKIMSHPEISVFSSHVVFSSGGRFYVLLPNTEKVKGAISEMRKEVDSWLWEEHQGAVSLGMDYIPFRYQNNMIELPGQEFCDLGTLWDKVNETINKRKNHKFEHIVLNQYQRLFDPKPTGGQVAVCSVSGIELGEREATTIDLDGALEQMVVSPLVKKQIRLGEALKDADFLLTFKGEEEDSTYLKKRSKVSIPIAGLVNYLFDRDELLVSQSDSRLITSADSTRVVMINRTDFIETHIKGNHVSYGFQFYGGNKQAQAQDGRNKTFEQLTETSDGDSTKHTYLGILRMDVDDLGDLFIRGFPSKSKSFAAYSSLSFMLDLFFRGYTNVLREKYADYLNIIYAGGDDIFAIGRWDKVISFADDVQSEFKAFIGRQDLTISAGIAIIHNKFPIAKAALMAGEAEKKAKLNQISRPKNALTFFNTTISWDSEFPYVKEMKDIFIDLIKHEGMAKSVLHKLMMFSNLKYGSQPGTNKKGGGNISYMWHTAYYLKRFKDRHDEKPGIVAFIDDLLNNHLITTERGYLLVALSARWAEVELKEIKNNS